MNKSRHPWIYVITMVVGLGLTWLVVASPLAAEEYVGRYGFFWMILPLPLSLVLMGLARRYFGRRGQIADPRMQLGAYLGAALLCGFLAQIGMLAYTIFTEPSTIVDIIPAVLVYVLSVLILAFLALVLRTTLPRWLAYPLMILLTFLGIVRGILYIISGNVGGAVAFIGRVLVLIAPPVNLVAFLAKDAAATFTVTPERFVLPFAYLLFVMALAASRLWPKGKRLQKVGAIALGFVVLVLGANFSTHRVDPVTQQALEVAIERSERGLWPNYRLGEVQVAIRDGGGELFLRDGAEAVYREATLGVLAYTATVVEGVPTLHVLPYEPSRAMYDPLGNVAPELAFDSYVSMLVHEGFHAYQMGDMGDGFLAESELDFDSVERSRQALAGLSEYNELWNVELQSAYDFLENQGAFAAYDEARRAREDFERASLGEADYLVYEAWFRQMETLEGTAFYVEMMSMPGEMQDSPQYQRLNTRDNRRISLGVQDWYYESGLARALILGLVEPNWQVNFDFSAGLVLATDTIG